MGQKAPTWNEERPIYRQLMDRIIERIINRTYREGELLPSVRRLADDFFVNPLTAARAYRELEQYVETQRGVGMTVRQGVRQTLLRQERKKFMREEWPAIRERIAALEIDLDQLLRS